MSELARRYAEALYGLAPDETALREKAANLMGDPAVWAALTSPLVGTKSKKAVLARLPGLDSSPLFLRFFGLLAEKGRMALLPDIVREFHVLDLNKRNTAECVLTCVRPPDAERRKRIQEVLCKRHHKAEVLLTIRIDPALLGGFTLNIEGVTYDKSVRGSLKALSRLLKEENAT